MYTGLADDTLYCKSNIYDTSQCPSESCENRSIYGEDVTKTWSFTFSDIFILNLETKYNAKAIGAYRHNSTIQIRLTLNDFHVCVCY